MLGNAFTAVLLGAIQGILEDLVGDEFFNELFNSIFTLVTQPLTFPWAAKAQFYFQALGLAIAILIIFVKGFSGIVRVGETGGNESFLGYMVRSGWPLIIIAFSPLIVSIVTTISGKIMLDLATHTDMNMISAIFEGGALGYFQSIADPSNIGKVIYFIMVLAILYYTTTVIFQCIKRQLQLTFLSIIAPLVAATTASENNAGDFVTILKEMLGIGVITALQILGLEACFTIGMNDSLVNVFGFLSPFVLIACFSALKKLPQWIERYTLAPSVSGGGGAFGRAGGMAAGAGARSAITSVVG